MTMFLRKFFVLLAGFFVLPSFAAAQEAAPRTVRYANEYNWSITPPENLTQAGAKVVNLPACPAGVMGNEPEYWVLIGKPGAAGAEPVKVTGGSCGGDGRPGTLRFNTAQSHAADRPFQAPRADCRRR